MVLNSSIRRAVIYAGLCTAILLPAFFTQAAEQVVGKTFYTSANIWYERPEQIESTNYHRGTVLPIGTKVKITEVFDETASFHGTWDAQTEDFIRFVDDSGLSYKIIFRPRHASKGMTVWDFFKQYFSEKDPMREGGPFYSLTPDEQQNVKRGEIAIGMGRNAVLMAYGYPPGHRTPSLKSDTWIYWESRSKTRTVQFSADRVTGGASAGAESRERKTASSIAECIKACKENTNRTPEQCFDACKPR